MAENSMRDAILSVVEAKGGSAEGVGPLDRDALDRLLDVMAGSDQPVTSGMSDAQVVRALAQYAHGGGGAQTLDVTLWNSSEGETLASVLPFEVRYVAGLDERTHRVTYSDPLPFESVTAEAFGATIHGVRVSGLPVGAIVKLTINADGAYVDSLKFGFANSDAPEPLSSPVDDVALAPVGGFVVAGQYVIVKSA